MIVVALRTNGSNARETWQQRHGRVKRERTTVARALRAVTRPAIPCTVLLTRIGPSAGLDDDNLRAALKGARDQVAEWLGVNDRDTKRVHYVYGQARGGAWGVQIAFGPPASGAQLELLGEVALERVGA